MDTVDNLQKIPEELKEPLIRGLVYHYLGESINSSFDRDDTAARSSYYKWKEIDPDGMRILGEDARSRAERDLRLIRGSFDAEQLTTSIQIQRDARYALQNAVGTLSRIVNLDPWTNVGDERPVRIYPRDVSEATRNLRELASQGIISPAQMYSQIQGKSAGGDTGVKPMPIIGIGADFARITATRADGTKFSASVEDEWEVIEEDPDQ